MDSVINWRVGPSTQEYTMQTRHRKLLFKTYYKSLKVNEATLFAKPGKVKIFFEFNILVQKKRKEKQNIKISGWKVFARISS